MKIFILLFLSLPKSSIHSDIPNVSEFTTQNESILLLKNLAIKAIAQEWINKFADKFTEIGLVSKKFQNYSGPVADIIEFALIMSDKSEEQRKEYLNNITQHMDKIDSKLDAISEQITFMDSKLTHSTKKTITELKFRDYVKHYKDLMISKQYFESLLDSFTSNSTLFLHQLDKYIEDYRQQDSDTNLVNILDSGSGNSDSIVENLIKLCRSYHKQNYGFSGSSTMKTIYDVYITAFMAVLKSNIILESALNLKTAITGQYYEEDRRFNHNRKNEIFERFFTSFEKAFNKLEDSDMDGFIDLSVHGNENNAKMRNVLQIFFENEDKLSITNNCAKDCDYFKDQKYTGGGCNGAVRDCSQAQNTNRYLRQNPQIDRIYLGYGIKKKWVGRGTDNVNKPNMEFKDSYRRGFHDCHVCKCVCDQYSSIDSVRKIYSGKITAPDGYVVTGIRFVESNKAIYPQIQVGKFLPLATVDQNSIFWLDIPSFRSFVTFDYDKHDIDFGDPSLVKFSGSVVTGVQFQSTYIGVSWSIYGRELIDFNMGILGDEVIVKTTGFLVSFDGTNLIPGLSTARIFSIGRDKRVEFGISNEDEDAGQSFVPYFDGNEISFEIKSPLSGITLIHYTNDANYAGFLRPVLRSLDYRELFNTSYEVEQFVVLNYTVDIQKDSEESQQRSLSFRLEPPFAVIILMSFKCFLN